MATFRKDALGKKGTHAVGQLESWSIDTVINGAIVKTSEGLGLDNFTLGELFFEGGEAHVKKATATTKAEDTVLLATPEVRLADEPLCNFYNGEGERATCVIPKFNLQFSTSKVKAGAVVGDKVTWDGTEFVKAVAEITAEKVFRVVEIEDEAMYSIDGATLFSLNVIK